ncbi:hypothetical protein JB92DRAFT_938848 [Gautieria morchelliformis]|nr:hypothetical protein JB92DRAFT_938848 [Gautieria morchelliformis]
MDIEHDTTWARYKFKFMQQPLIPLGVAATCVALVGATRKMQAGDRNSFNRQLLRWLRFRVLAQGLTIAAAVVGGWKISQERRAARQSGITSAAEEETKNAKEQAEKARFSSRMKEAEEAHRLETRTGGK